MTDVELARLMGGLGLGPVPAVMPLASPADVARVLELAHLLKSIRARLRRARQRHNAPRAEALVAERDAHSEELHKLRAPIMDAVNAAFDNLARLNFWLITFGISPVNNKKEARRLLKCGVFITSTT